MPYNMSQLTNHSSITISNNSQSIWEKERDNTLEYKVIVSIFQKSVSKEEETRQDQVLFRHSILR